MDWYLISVLVFVALFAVIVYKDRKKFKRESIFLLRKTQRGKGFIVSVGTRFPRAWKVVGFVSVLAGFYAMAFGVKFLIDNVVKSVTTSVSTPTLALILPSPTPQPVFGFGVLGVPFWYWIICIALLALVHEGLHGIFSAREGVRIKSLGLGILAVIPLAFVEPDEKQLQKKGVWPQLRVFSAGSFANFMLAGLTALIIIWMSNAIFLASGVAFGNTVSPNLPPYPASKIRISDVTGIGDASVSGSEDIEAAMYALGDNETVPIRTGNATFFLKKYLLAEQLNQSADEIVVFEDYPAARAGLEGVIMKMNNYEIRDSLDLSLALDGIGPGQRVTVKTKVGDDIRSYDIVTVGRPDRSPYGPQPDDMIYTFAALEHVIPGSIEFYHHFGDSWSRFLGQRVEETWSYVDNRIAVWEWVGDSYPLLKERSEGMISFWEDRLAGHSNPGFIGITYVMTYYELIPGLGPVKPGIDFLQGLLVFMFLINLGVGIVNLLPIKPLDGGRMLDVVLKRYAPRIAPRAVRYIGLFVLLLIILNFLPLGALF